MLAPWPPTRQAIVGSGALPLLVDLAEKGAVQAKVEAVGALANLANATVKSAILSAGAVPPIIKLLRNGTDAQKKMSVLCIRSIAAHHAESATCLVEGVVAQPLVKLLATSTDSKTRQECASAIFHLISASRGTCTPLGLIWLELDVLGQ